LQETAGPTKKRGP